MLVLLRINDGVTTSPQAAGHPEFPLVAGATVDPAGLGPAPSGPATVELVVAQPGITARGGPGEAALDPAGPDVRVPPGGEPDVVLGDAAVGKYGAVLVYLDGAST